MLEPSRYQERPQKVGLSAPGTSRPMTGDASSYRGTYHAMR